MLKKQKMDEVEKEDSADSSTLGGRFDKKEVEQLLKYGAFDLFNDQADAESAAFMDEASFVQAL